MSTGSQWIIAQFTDRNHGDLILRLNESADTTENVATFPLRIGVAVPLSSPAEFTTIDPLEHQIQEHVGDRDDGMLVAIVSGTSPPYFREFISYVSPNFDLANFRHVLAARLPHLEIQTYSEDDPDWHAFRSLRQPNR
jgi:hypothetical protein